MAYIDSGGAGAGEFAPGAGPSKGHGCTHVHPIIFAKQSKLVVIIIHAYTPVIRFRSD